ncbi:unnamed protein product, partial [Ectocarpus sp. 12 AP-2014]
PLTTCTNSSATLHCPLHRANFAVVEYLILSEGMDMDIPLQLATTTAAAATTSSATSRAAAAALAAARSAGSSRGFKTTTAAQPATATTTDAGARRGPATVPVAQRLRAPGGLHPRERARASPADRVRDRPLGRAAEEPGREVGLCPRQSRGAGAREVLPQAGPNEP